MQNKERDLIYMDTKLRRVEELIKNSPVVQSKRVALKENTDKNVASSDEKVSSTFWNCCRNNDNVFIQKHPFLVYVT